MSFFRSGKSRILSIAILALILAILASMVSFTSEPIKVYAETVDYWELKVGDDTVAVLAEEEDATKIVQKITDNYVEDGAAEVDVKLSPAITTNKITVLKDDVQPEVERNLDNIVATLTQGQGEQVESTYIVQEGDTPWDISMALDMSVDQLISLNPEQNFDEIMVGDELNIAEVQQDQLVNVIVEYQEDVEEIVPSEVVYEEDPEMYVDEEQYVKTEGQDGKKMVTKKTVAINGVVKETKEIASEEIEAPVNQVVVYGTLEREEEAVEEEANTEETEGTEDSTSEEASSYEDNTSEETSTASETSTSSETAATEETTSSSDESYGNYSETFDESAAAAAEPEPTYEEATYSGSGQDVVNYALQFVGNPYVWGGTSLTNGCDCSGFVYRVFNDCGYSIARWPDNDYPHVSASELRPGDICRYGGHYAIYIGDGMEISAVNESQGIRTHPMYYSRSSFMYGIRVIG